MNSTEISRPLSKSTGKPTAFARVTRKTCKVLRSPFRFRGMLAVAALMLLGFQRARAADITWNNTGTNFNAGASWTGGNAPTSADSAKFAVVSVTDPNLTSSLTIKQLHFSTAATSGYDLTSSNSSVKLTLTSTGTGTADQSGSALVAENTSGTNTISAPIILGAASGATQTFDATNGGTTVISGVISATYSNVNLSFASGGTWKLTGNNSYSGGTTLNDVSLIIGNNNAFGTGSVLTDLAGTVNISTDTTDITLPNLVTLGGGTSESGITFQGSHSISLTNTLGVDTTGGGTRVIVNNITGSSTLNLANVQLSVDNLNSSLDIKGSGTTLISGNITNGTGGATTPDLTYSGTGILSLSGTNTYGGVTTVSGGLVQFAKQVSLYNNTPTSWTATKLIVASGATAAFNVGGTGEFTSSNIQTLSGLGTANGGFKNGSTLGLDTTNASGGTFIYSNVIANTNGNANVVGLTKLGTGTLVLDQANTYSGATKVNGGMLQFAKQVSLYNNTPASWTATKLIVASGATAAFNVGGTGEFTSSNIQTLSGLGTASGGFMSGSTLGLDTTNASGGTFTHSNVIANTNGNANVVGLTKLGTGALVLDQANTYTGATTVSGGKLTIGSSGTINFTSGVSIAGGELNYNSTTALSKTVSFSGTGGTLSGSGTITQAVAVTSGNTYTPGERNAAGTQALTGGISFASGSIFEWDINTASSAYDKVTGGGLTVTSGAQFLVASSTPFSDTFWNSQHTWSDIFGSNAISGFSVSNFLYSAAGSLVSAPSSEGYFTITDGGLGGTQKYLNWTAVPEPGGALAGLLLGAGLLRRRR